MRQAIIFLAAALLVGCGGGGGGDPVVPLGDGQLAVSPAQTVGRDQVQLTLAFLAGQGQSALGPLAEVTITHVNGLGGPVSSQVYRIATVPWSVPVARSGAERLVVEVRNFRTGTITQIGLGKEWWGLEYTLTNVR